MRAGKGEEGEAGAVREAAAAAAAAAAAVILKSHL
jgi:hypothetical protein